MLGTTPENYHDGGGDGDDGANHHIDYGGATRQEKTYQCDISLSSFTNMVITINRPCMKSKWQFRNWL